MGSIISYIDSKNYYNFSDKNYKCERCYKKINPDETLMQLWCYSCNRIWCNDCAKYSLDSITKLRFDACGRCCNYNMTQVKALLFDIITKEKGNKAELYAKLYDKYNLKEILLTEYQKDLDYLLEIDAIFD